LSKVALIGASGNVGSRILKELSDRGHQVTAIARDPDKIAKLPNCMAVKGDASDPAGLAALLRGHDAVVSSVPFSTSKADLLIGAVRAAGVKRYIVVGGAGSLDVAPGRRLLDQPDFKPEWRPEATAGAAFLDDLRGVTDLDWTFFSPAAYFHAGARTGTFRLGKDNLIASDKGSSISFEDYAIALVDELERPQHIRERFTIGY